MSIPRILFLQPQLLNHLPQCSPSPPTAQTPALVRAALPLSLCFQKQSVAIATASNKINSPIQSQLQIRNPIQVPQPARCLMAGKIFPVAMVQRILCQPPRVTLREILSRKQEIIHNGQAKAAKCKIYVLFIRILR